MYWRALFIVVAAISLCVPASARPAMRLRPAAVRNTPFTLAAVNGCFYIPPPPGGTVWPLAPVDRTHGIRGSFNGVRGSSPHFGVDVEALTNDAPVYSIASGFVGSEMKLDVHHFAVRTLALGHKVYYYHVVPLATLFPGEWVNPGQLIGHVVMASSFPSISHRVVSRTERTIASPHS